ncbi:MAG: leucine-rich repeat protein [Dysgonamonadaceae bacterium]|jgi:hypothetical protein|nr:leucine-rich repeat protein [Dysgonamonadaceae bacterium]
MYEKSLLFLHNKNNFVILSQIFANSIMKALIKILLVFCVISLSASMAKAQTSGTCGDNLTWTITGSGRYQTLTISGTGEMDNYFSGGPISPWYYNTSLETIVIEDGVTSIGSWAFLNCQHITSISIPNSVASIGAGAFNSCSDLISVIIPSGVPSIGDYTFTSCYKLTSITIPNSVTSIGKWAFVDCDGLTSITIPESVKFIGEYAFYHSNFLTSIIIPNGVLSIGKRTFYACYHLTSVIIPNSVLSIGEGAFEACYGLTSVTIPNSVTSIGDDAFASCDNVTSITIQAITPPSIERYTFWHITDTVLVTVPCVSESAYRSVPYWRDFANIVADNNCEAVCEDVVAALRAENAALKVDITAYKKQIANLENEVARNQLDIDYLYNVQESLYRQIAELQQELRECKNDTRTFSPSEIASQEINIFPQPVQNELFIHSENGMKKVEIFDTSGHTVGATLVLAHSQEQGQSLWLPLRTSINVSHLPAGVYLLKIETDKGVKTERFVKK